MFSDCSDRVKRDEARLQMCYSNSHHEGGMQVENVIDRQGYGVEAKSSSLIPITSCDSRSTSDSGKMF